MWQETQAFGYKKIRTKTCGLSTSNSQKKWWANLGHLHSLGPLSLIQHFAIQLLASYQFIFLWWAISKWQIKKRRSYYKDLYSSASIGEIIWTTKNKEKDTFPAYARTKLKVQATSRRWQEKKLKHYTIQVAL